MKKSVLNKQVYLTTNKTKDMKTEKLELKHLAPYLPYGLKLYYEGFPIVEMKGLPETFNFEKFKPILRPLSDLTKEIEHNGVSFIPNNTTEVDCPKEYDETFISFVKNGRLNYVDHMKMVKWHFDVDGLIEKGLAIDINQLKD